jgi:hypothetical protein
VVPRSAGVGDHDRDEAPVRPVPNGGLDPDLGRYADDCKRSDLRATQRELERAALECGHRKRVEDGFRGERGELRHELERGGVAQERRHDALDAILSFRCQDIAVRS